MASAGRRRSVRRHQLEAGSSPPVRRRTRHRQSPSSSDHRRCSQPCERIRREPSWYGVQKMPAPDLDAHQPEDRCRPHRRVRHGLGNQPGDGRRVEEAATIDRGNGQRVVDELPQIVLQPPAQRRAEAGLGPMDDLGRADVARSPSSAPICHDVRAVSHARAAHLPGGRDRCRGTARALRRRPPSTSCPCTGDCDRRGRSAVRAPASGAAAACPAAAFAGSPRAGLLSVQSRAMRGARARTGCGFAPHLPRGSTPSSAARASSRHARAPSQSVVLTNRMP